MEKDHGNYKILVVEDNQGDFVLIEDFLDEMISNTSISHAKSFKECKSFLTGDQPIFNVILLDLSLPDKSGEGLILEMLSMSSGVPIIVLTGYTDIAFGVKSLSLGISDYLLKEDLSPAALYKSILYSIERKKKSKELEESEKRYSDLFQLSPLSMWVYDVESLAFLDVNNAAVAHYGYSREEFLSMTLRDIRNVEDIEKLESTVSASKNTDGKYFHGTFRHRKKNGEFIQAEIQTNAVQFENKQAMVVLAVDITERLKYIEAIEIQNKKLKEISWMQSHVVRAPVARLMGLVNLIQNYDNSETEQNEILGHILSSAHELDNIIRDISDKTTAL